MLVPLDQRRYRQRTGTNLAQNYYLAENNLRYHNLFIGSHGLPVRRPTFRPTYQDIIDKNQHDDIMIRMQKVEIKSLDKDTLLNEALCGSGRILTKSDPTEQEQDVLRAAEIKTEWLKKMMPNGLAAQIAFDGEESIGFIEYMPIELSNFYSGKDLYIINCMVAPHTHHERKSYQERIPGCGTALVKAMIMDVKGKCKGIIGPLTIAYTRNVKGFFAKFGFEEYEYKRSRNLIRRFEPVDLPDPVKYEDRYRFNSIPRKIVIDTFWRSYCRIMPLALINLRDVCKDYSEKVILNEFCLDEREELQKYGSKCVTYFNGKSPRFSYELQEKEKIREILSKLLDD